MQSYLEERASYQLANTADAYIAGLYTSAAAANIVSGATATQSSLVAGNEIICSPYLPTTNPADFYTKVLLPLKVKLSQANVPMQGRYVVMPAWAEALLEQTQAFVSVTDMQGDPSKVFSNGMIGRAAGFDIYSSNNAIEYNTGNATGTSNGTSVPSTGGYVVQAGHNMALTYAEQIVQVEALRLQTTFGDGVRGLHVFGSKLVRPDCIAVAGVARPNGI